MKKLIYLFSLSVLLASCSGNDDSDNNTNPGTMLVKKMVFNDGFESITTNFTYNGQKLVATTDSDGYHAVITYTGDLITKWEDFGSDNELVNRTTFEYNAAGQLIKYTDLDFEDDYGVVYTYMHNTDGSISYSLMSGDTASQTFPSSGTITATQYTEEQFGDIITRTFTYDNKNNPFKNITGYDKIYFADNNEALNFANNWLTVSDSQNPDEPSTATYTYNPANYPLIQDQYESGTEHYTTTYTYQ